jgi:hypothetical protein
MQAVNSRKVNDFSEGVGTELGQTHVLFHGDTRVVAHLLIQPGEPVEERRLSRIGTADQRYPKRALRRHRAR